MTVSVAVGGRVLRLTNLDKPLYRDGFTKAEVIDYYSRIAPVMLPHLEGRPITVTRWPDGVDATPFYGKNLPPGAPEWLASAVVPTGGSGRATVTAPLVAEPAALVYLANLAALEIHVPQWRVSSSGALPPDRLVVDLDPGPPAGLAACCEVALVARELMRVDGLQPWPKLSGGKGLQLLAAVGDRRPGATAAYARDLARRLTLALPALVVDRMDKAVRAGRVFLDWSQNNPAKNTVAAYSLRARATATVSAPISWQEVATARDDLAFSPAQVLARVAAEGDLLAGLDRDEGPATLPVNPV